ncbi:hypothetical protein IWX91DRAFT_350458 [Phyllosticta citricarpa]
MGQASARSPARIPFPFLILLLLTAAVALAMALLPQPLRHFLQSVVCDAIGWSKAAQPMRIGALLFAVWNIKVLPGVYHLRIALAILPSLLPQKRQHRHAAPRRVSKEIPADTLPLFTPHTLSTFAPPLEHDSNLHKSNSTYFSDLDVSRSALLARLFLPTLRHVAKNTQSGSSSGGSGSGSGGLGVKLTVALGGAQADFKRGIGLQRYSVSSRIVGWDRKWIVVGSWFEERRIRHHQHHRSSDEEGKGTVYASALAKYVFKAGRATIRPVIVMVAAGLLPLVALDGLDCGKGQAGVFSDKEAEIVDALRAMGPNGLKDWGITEKIEDGEERVDDGEWMRRVEEVRQDGRVVTERFLGLDAVADLA